MGFNLHVKGQSEEIIIPKETITMVKYDSDTPDDSNARATDLSVTLIIEGKISPSVSGDQEDDSRKLALWSVIPAESVDAYRTASLEVISAGQMVRKIMMPNAFVVDYTETYGNQSGTGVFMLKIKQKKEKVKEVTIEGGYQANES